MSCSVRQIISLQGQSCSSGHQHENFSRGGQVPTNCDRIHSPRNKFGCTYHKATIQADVFLRQLWLPAALIESVLPTAASYDRAMLSLCYNRESEILSSVISRDSRSNDPRLPHIPCFPKRIHIALIAVAASHTSSQENSSEIPVVLKVMTHRSRYPALSERGRVTSTPPGSVGGPNFCDISVTSIVSRISWQLFLKS